MISHDPCDYILLLRRKYVAHYFESTQFVQNELIQFIHQVPNKHGFACSRQTQ